MITKPTSDQLLASLREFLISQGYSTEDLDSKDKLRELILPALANSRGIQSSLYSWSPAHGSGVVRQVKNNVLTKMKNIVVNVLEKTVMRQQKFNELSYQAIVQITAELDQINASHGAKPPTT